MLEENGNQCRKVVNLNQVEISEKVGKRTLMGMVVV